MRVVIVMAILLCLSGACLPARAQDKSQERAVPGEKVILAIVAKVDPRNSMVTVTHVTDREKMIIQVPADELADLQPGDRVRIWLLPDSNIARHIRRITKR